MEMRLVDAQSATIGHSHELHISVYRRMKTVCRPFIFQLSGLASCETALHYSTVSNALSRTLRVLESTIEFFFRVVQFS